VEVKDIVLKRKLGSTCNFHRCKYKQVSLAQVSSLDISGFPRGAGQKKSSKKSTGTLRRKGT
ncbi:MAG: hypothetical protein AAGA50_29745, partial [Pseudomonadota bacterium]